MTADTFETAVRAALARHRAALRRDSERRTRAFEQRFLLSRLGLCRADLDIVAAASAAAALPPDLRHRLEQRLLSETGHLLRLARAGSPRYDLNRHIAVRRALAWLRGEAAAEEEDGCDRRSGRAWNGRFRRRARRRPGRPEAEKNHREGGGRPPPGGPPGP